MKGRLNNSMLQLRKNGYHPNLFESAFDGSYFYPPVEQIVGQCRCGKFRLLCRLLNRLFALHHKVVIFSQWTKILDIMEYCFSEKGSKVCRIDGSVKLDERKRQIEEFVLSTGAGGLGTNLTSADACILYDSDWSEFQNSQMDVQAMDRFPQIGQTKPVHGCRLATAQSVEGRILKRAFSKLKLQHVMIGKGQFHQERAKSNSTEVMEDADILALLRDEETAENRLNRSDLVVGSSPDDITATGSIPAKGPGWEAVMPTASGAMLSTLNS